MCADNFDNMLKDVEKRAIRKILENGLSEENIARATKIATEYTIFEMSPPEKQLEILLGLNETDDEDDRE